MHNRSLCENPMKGERCALAENTFHVGEEESQVCVTSLPSVLTGCEDQGLQLGHTACNLLVLLGLGIGKTSSPGLEILAKPGTEQLHIAADSADVMLQSCFVLSPFMVSSGVLIAKSLETAFKLTDAIILLRQQSCRGASKRRGARRGMLCRSGSGGWPVRTPRVIVQPGVLYLLIGPVRPGGARHWAAGLHHWSLLVSAPDSSSKDRCPVEEHGGRRRIGSRAQQPELGAEAFDNLCGPLHALAPLTDGVRGSGRRERSDLESCTDLEALRYGSPWAQLCENLTKGSGRNPKAELILPFNQTMLLCNKEGLFLNLGPRQGEPHNGPHRQQLPIPGTGHHIDPIKAAGLQNSSQLALRDFGVEDELLTKVGLARAPCRTVRSRPRVMQGLLDSLDPEGFHNGTNRCAGTLPPLGLNGKILVAHGEGATHCILSFNLGPMLEVWLDVGFTDIVVASCNEVLPRQELGTLGSMTAGNFRCREKPGFTPELCQRAQDTSSLEHSRGQGVLPMVTCHETLCLLGRRAEPVTPGRLCRTAIPWW